MSLLLVGVLTADPEGLIAEMHRQNPTLVDQGVSDGALRSASWVTAVVCLVWAVASGLLAVLAFQRRRWAAIGLVISAAIVGLFCLARLPALAPARGPRPAGCGDGRPAAAVLGAAVAGPARRPRCRAGPRHDEMSR